jgi:hypothetical protein
VPSANKDPFAEFVVKEDNADPFAEFVVKEEPSKTESVIRGGLQGATLGYSDEIVAGLAGGLPALLKGENVKEAYSKRLEQDRAENKAAEKANPKSYLAGEIGGGVASSFVPGLGVAKGAAGVAKLAGLGAAAGAGYSEAKDVGGLVKDAAVGGLAAGAAAKGLGAAKGFVDRAPTQARNILTEHGISPGALGSKGTGNLNLKSLDMDDFFVDAMKKSQDKKINSALLEGSKTLAKEVVKGVAGATVGYAVGGETGALIGGVLGSQKIPSALGRVTTLTAAAPGVQKASKALFSKASKAGLELVDDIPASSISPREIKMKIVDPATSKKIGQAIVWEADPRSINKLGKTGFSLKDIRLDKDARGKGIGSGVVKQLTDKFGPLASDTRGNISDDGLKLFKKLGKKQKDGSFIIDNKLSAKQKALELSLGVVKKLPESVAKTTAGKIAEED